MIIANFLIAKRQKSGPDHLQLSRSDSIVMDEQNIKPCFDNLIRYKFLNDNNNLFDEIDIFRVRTDDWQINRFVIEHQDIYRALYALRIAMRWRKEFGIHRRNDQYFPKEFYEALESDQTGRDRDGRYVHWSNINANRIAKIPEIHDLLKQFAAHVNEKTDKKVHRNGLLFVIDLSKVNFSNLGVDMIRFNIELNQYYTLMLRSNLIMGVPGLFKGLTKKMFSLCGPNIRKSNLIIKREDLLDYVSGDIIPIEYGGQRLFNRNIPDNVKPLKELNYFQFSTKTIEKFH